MSELVKHESRETMLPFFTKVSCSAHWKNPINKILTADENERTNISNAISFFTGTEASWEELGIGRWRVTAPGYYLGPCN